MNKNATWQFAVRLMTFSLLQFLIMFTAIGISFAHDSNAQHYLDRRLSIDAENVHFKKVLSDIEKSTDVRFVYSSQVVESGRIVTIHQRNKTLGQVLQQLLTPLKINYELVGRKIVLSHTTGYNRTSDLGPDEDGSIQNNALARMTTGKVTDDNGLVLAGVNVVLKGTQIGTTTDVEGNYTLDVQRDGILVFSFVGYKSQEVPVEGRTEVSIRLISDDQALQEIVVVGYGTQKQREVTGSIATLQAGQLEDQPVGQFAQKLQGRIAGVQINQATGVPGSGMTIRIRGAASINAGNSPLYVVEGFPIVGDINNINPNEIETFSVLKGASAAALYGSRAANGVVLITTKQAKPGKTAIQFSATFGVAKVPQKGRAKLMNAREFLQDRKAIFEDKIKYEGYTGGIPELYQHPESWTGPDTDWYEELLQPAGQNSYNLSLMTNKDKFSSATTVGYYKEKGAVINSDFQRYSFRSNNVYQVNKSIRVGVNIAPTYQVSNNPTNASDDINNGDGFYSLIYSAIITPPIFSPYETNPDGTKKVSFSGPGLFTFPNWKRSLEETINKGASTRVLGNAFVEVDVLKDFRFKSSVSIDLQDRKQRTFSPSTVGTIFANAPRLATGSYRTSQYTSWLTENTLTYNKTIGTDHHIEGLAGYSAQLFREENNLLTGTSFPDDAVSWIDAAAIKSGGSSSTEWALLSMFTRLNYNYKGKYLLAVSIRRDGSSRFGSENRWGSFPSISAGWIISDEAFAQKWKSVSYLKLRAEYGDAGNFNIGNYNQFGNIVTTNYVFGGSLFQGRSPSSIGNNRLTWETTRGMDFGVDMGLFNDRVSVTLDYFTKRTKNMLYQVDIPAGTGFPNIQDNIGEFKFWGYEVGATTRNLVGMLKWTTDFNVSVNRNRVMQLGTNNTPIGGIGEYPADIWKTEVGRPMGQFYGYIFDGIYQNQGEFDSQAKHSTSQVGTARMKDLNNDGVIDTEDRTYIGNPSPKFLFGINNSFNYKNFDLNLVFSGAYGNKMYYSLAEWTETLEGIFNVEKYMKDRWRSEAEPGAGIIGRSLSGTTSFPRSNSDRLVLDASYLTLKNVTLGYSLPHFPKFVSKARIFLSVQQAFVLTKYKGSNPEASLNGLNGLREGVDVSPYPVPRTIALGLNINF